MSKAGSGWGRTSLVLGLLSLFNSFVAFGREIAVSGVFGANEQTDAFYLAYSLLVAGPALLLNVVPQVFVPKWSGATWDRDDEATELLSGSLVSGLLLFGATAAAVWAALPALTDWLAPGFTEAGKAAFVANARALCPALLLLSELGVINALMRARGHFAIAQTSMVGVSLGALAGVWFGRHGGSLEAVAAGASWGLVVQTAVFAVYLVKQRVPLIVSPSSLRLGVSALLVATGLIVLNGSGGYAATLIDRYYAAKLPPGDYSCMGYALRLIAVPYMLVWGSLIVVVLTDLSRACNEGDRASSSRLFVRALRLTLLTIIPLQTGMAGASESLVATVFGRGAFDAQALATTSVLLVCSVPTVAAGAVRGILLIGMFSAGDVRSSFWLGGIRIVGMLAVYPFVWEPWGAVGLFLGIGAVDVITLPLALWAARQSFDIPLKPLAIFAAQIGVVAGAAAFGAWSGQALAQRFELPLLVAVAGAIAGAGLTAGGAAAVFGLKEAWEVVEALGRRLRRR